MLLLNAMGINMRFPSNFVIDRPNGTGDYLFVLFKTNSVVYHNHTEQEVSPNSFILFDKNAPQHYRANHSNYVDHFIHFDMDIPSADLENCTPIFNKPLPVPDIHDIEDYLHLISREQLSQSDNRLQYIDSLLKILLCKLFDQSVSGSGAPSVSTYTGLLRDLRAQMYSNAGNFHSIHELADRANLSASYFQQLYTEHFGVSCYEDLLQAKTAAAQFYLRTTNFTVHSISELCGYDNDIVFMRCFKKRTGMSPTQYRNQVINIPEALQ